MAEFLFSFRIKFLITLVRLGRFIRMFPNIGQTHGCMKAIKHNQRQRNVTQNIPQRVTVELVSEIMYNKSK